MAQDPLTQELAQMVRVRRDLVNQRTMTANQLKAVLKLYYPLALELLQDDTTTALAAHFVLKFPTLRALQEAPLHQVRRFFRGQSCRLTEGLEQREVVAHRRRSGQPAGPLEQPQQLHGLLPGSNAQGCDGAH